MDYSEAKLQQLDAAATYRVYGHELEFGQGSTGAAARLRWRLILPCFCVHDSPDSPCPCMRGDDRFFWWLVDDAVVREGPSGRKDHEGNELQFFDVLLDSQIMVESLQPVSTGALKRLGDTISAQSVRGLASDSGPGVPQSIEMKIPPWAWKLLAQIAGYLIDKFWDELIKPIPGSGWPPRP
jgi:hypothetical protein